MRKLMHNILFENAEIIAGIISIYILCGIIFPLMESIITDKTSMSFVLLLGISGFIITIVVFVIGGFLLSEYCYDQKTESENYANNKYKS